MQSLPNFIDSHLRHFTSLLMEPLEHKDSALLKLEKTISQNCDQDLPNKRLPNTRRGESIQQLPVLCADLTTELIITLKYKPYYWRTFRASVQETIG